MTQALGFATACLPPSRFGNYRSVLHICSWSWLVAAVCNQLDYFTGVSTGHYTYTERIRLLAVQSMLKVLKQECMSTAMAHKASHWCSPAVNSMRSYATMYVVKQVERYISALECAVTHSNTSKHMCSKRAQTLACWIQLYESNGAMLLMHILATLSSNHIAAKRLAGYVTSAQMATCTAGQPQCTTGQMVMDVLSATDAKYASITAWLPRTLPWQLSGTMLQIIVRLKAWWHKASVLAGSVMLVATSGVKHPMLVSKKRKGAVSAMC